ncbi:MAG: hypothetical protein ACREN7_04660 [Candidatus Dormibacteria bacterium]
MLGVTVAVLGFTGASQAQQRRDFQGLVADLRLDLGGCSHLAQAAVTAWRRAPLDQQLAAAAAHRAHGACLPGTSNAVWNLTVYSVPGSLPQGLHLAYAVSALGVWAQEDVAPAMAAVETLARHPQDREAGQAYRRDAAFAKQNLASANRVLSRAAARLGDLHLRLLELVSLDLSGSQPAP